MGCANIILFPLRCFPHILPNPVRVICDQINEEPQHRLDRPVYVKRPLALNELLSDHERGGADCGGETEEWTEVLRGGEACEIQVGDAALETFIENGEAVFRIDLIGEVTCCEHGDLREIHFVACCENDMIDHQRGVVAERDLQRGGRLLARGHMGLRVQDDIFF